MEEVEALCKVLREDNCNLEKLDLSFNLLNVEQITMVTGVRLCLTATALWRVAADRSTTLFDDKSRVSRQALGARAARAMLTPGIK